MSKVVLAAIQEMICDHLGEIAWRRISAKSAKKTTHCAIGTSDQNDVAVHKLIESSAAEFGLVFNEFIEQFGKYWVRYLNRRGLISLRKRDSGDLFPSIEMINAVGSSYLPDVLGCNGRFYCQATGGDWVFFRYVTNGTHFSHFTRGIVKGVCSYLNIRCDITMVIQTPEVTEMLVKLKR